MPIFRFKMLGSEGKVDKGVVELPFDDDAPAIRYLERQGGVVIAIQKLGTVMSWLTKLATQGFSRVGRSDLAEFFNNMAMLLGAGVPVLSAMDEIMEEIKNPMLLMTLRFMRTDIEGGQTFGEALSRHPKVFNPLVQYMCRIGEETGMLDRMCRKSGEHLEHIEEIVSGTKRALVYPGFILGVVILSCFFWFYFVVPRIVKLFSDMGVTTPAPTRALIAISNWFQMYFGWTVIGVVGGIILLSYLRKNSTRVHYILDSIALRVPVFSTIIETSIIARVTEYLGILIGAGVGVLRTLEIITESMTNLVYKGRLILVQDSVRNGNALSDSMKQAEALHPFAVRMVSVGEQTGRIEEQTEYVAKLYRDKLSALVEVLGKTLEPAMLVFMGLLFGAIFAGLLLPIYDMIGKVG
ncbi:type II secretion system F family protein [Desulfobaculum sp. SPO524]|uniref:type II secretion system F family protein n=1 Tax=Desulfobaculum sp. SPO524 TaxID=3378071 RepID=UPI003854E854